MLSVLDSARNALKQVLDDPETTVDRSLIDSVSKLASAHAALSREASKWNTKARREVASSSIEERKAGVVAFITALPLADRMEVLRSLESFERSTSGGLQFKLS